MANEDTAGLLDARIAALEKELEAAKRAADRIAGLTNDLASLKRAREILFGQGRTPEVTVLPPRTVTPNGTTASATPPIGFIIKSAIHEAGKPLTVSEITNAVRALRPDVVIKTIGAVLSQYVKGGHLRRVGPATYALPEAESNQSV